MFIFPFYCASCLCQRVSADSCNVTTTSRTKEAFSEKNEPPDTRNESGVSEPCMSCPAPGERHRDNVRRVYSSDPHTSPQPSSSYEDTYVSFMEPFSEWNCCNVIDAPTIKRRSPDTVQTTLSSSNAFVFPLQLPAFLELFKFTPQMNNLANECLGCLID